MYRSKRFEGSEASFSKVKKGSVKNSKRNRSGLEYSYARLQTLLGKPEQLERQAVHDLRASLIAAAQWSKTVGKNLPEELSLLVRISNVIESLNLPKNFTGLELNKIQAHFLHALDQLHSKVKSNHQKYITKKIITDQLLLDRLPQQIPFALNMDPIKWYASVASHIDWYQTRSKTNPSMPNLIPKGSTRSGGGSKYYRTLKRAKTAIATDSESVDVLTPKTSLRTRSLTLGHLTERGGHVITPRKQHVHERVMSINIDGRKVELLGNQLDIADVRSKRMLDRKLVQQIEITSQQMVALIGKNKKKLPKAALNTHSLIDNMPPLDNYKEQTVRLTAEQVGPRQRKITQSRAMHISARDYLESIAKNLDLQVTQVKARDAELGHLRANSHFGQNKAENLVVMSQYCNTLMMIVEEYLGIVAKSNGYVDFVVRASLERGTHIAREIEYSIKLPNHRQIKICIPAFPATGNVAKVPLKLFDIMPKVVAYLSGYKPEKAKRSLSYSQETETEQTEKALPSPLFYF